VIKENLAQNFAYRGISEQKWNGLAWRTFHGRLSAGRRRCRSQWDGETSFR